MEFKFPCTHHHSKSFLYIIHIKFYINISHFIIISDINLLYSNTVIIGLDSTNLNYDRETPNGDFVLLERTLKALPTQPKVHVVNIFNLARIVGDDAKTKKVEYTRDEAHVPLVSTEIKLE